jgi:tubulin beta
MGEKYWQVVCDENGIGGDGKYCVDGDAQLDRNNVLYRQAPGGKNWAKAHYTKAGHEFC